jgi:hypothetical protein
MTTHQSDASSPAVPADSAPQWSAGTSQDGVDERIELARINAAAQVAVRDARYPSGPALLFNLPDWHALVGVGVGVQPGEQPDLVDLRSVDLRSPIADQRTISD